MQPGGNGPYETTTTTKKKKKTRDIGEEGSVSMQGSQARTDGFKGVFKGGFRSEPCESLTVIPEERLLVKLQCPERWKASTHWMRNKPT